MSRRTCSIWAALIAVLLVSVPSGAEPLPGAPLESVGDKYWIQSLSEQYGLSEEDVRAMRKDGLEWQELNTYLESVYPHEPIAPGTQEFVDLAEGTGISPIEAIKAYELAVKYRRDPAWLASLYLECGDWSRIADAFGRYDRAVSERNKVRYKGASQGMAERVANAFKKVYWERAYEIDQLMSVSDEDRIADILFFADIYSDTAVRPRTRAVEYAAQLDPESVDTLPDMSGLHELWPHRRLPDDKLATIRSTSAAAEASDSGQFGFRLAAEPTSQPAGGPAAQMQAQATAASEPTPSLVAPSGLYDTGNVSPFRSYFQGHSERIDPYSGSVTIQQTDFTLPGMHGLDFTLTRTYNNQRASMGTPIVGTKVDYYRIASGIRTWDTTEDHVSGTGHYVEEVFYSFEYSAQTNSIGSAIGDLHWVRCLTYYDADGNTIDYVTSSGDQWGVRGTPSPEDVTAYYEVYGSVDYDPTYLEKLYGFGVGWSLAFPSIEKSAGAMYLHMGNGTVYEIISDSNGYHLDNYYLENLQFSRDDGYTDGTRTSYYSLRLKDGSMWYFTSAGLPLAAGNKFGDFIRFETGSTGGATRITKVIDTLGRTISFVYDSASVRVTVSKPKSSAVEFGWTYALTDVGQHGKKQLSQAAPSPEYQLSYSMTYQYAVATTQFVPVVKGHGTAPSVQLKYLNLISMTNPMEGSTTFEYSEASKRLGKEIIVDPSQPPPDPVSVPGPADDSTIGYYKVSRRYDMVPTIAEPDEGGVPIIAISGDASFTYDVYDETLGMATTVRTPEPVAGQEAVPAVESWGFDVYHRIVYHKIVGEGCGVQRAETETVSAKYTYEGTAGQLPLIEERTVSLSPIGSSVPTVTRKDVTTNAWDDLGNLVSATGPDGRTTRYTYDPTFSMLLTQFEETSADGAARTGRLTEYLLDPTKKVVLEKKQGIASFTETSGEQIGTIPEVSNIRMATGWTWRSPVGATGFHMVIKWYASGFWDDSAYTLSYRRVGTERWEEAESFHKYGTLGSSSGTRIVDIGPLDEGQYDLKIDVIDPQISVLPGSYATGVIRTWKYEGPVSRESFTYYPSAKGIMPGGNVETSTVYAFNGTTVEAKTTYQYDPNHGAFLADVSNSVTDADNNTTNLHTHAEYDTLGRMTSYTTSQQGGSASTTTYQYDLIGRLTKATPPSQAVGGQNPQMVWDYSRSPREVWKTDELGRTSIETYDGLGRFVKLELIEGAVHHVKTLNLYDPLGRVVAQFDGEGNRTDHEYDAFGREIRASHPDGAVAESWSIPVGAPSSIPGTLPVPTDRPNWPDVRVSTTVEDVVDADGQHHPVYKGYDVLGRLVWEASNPKSTPPAGIPVWDQVWHKYDTLGRLVATAVQPTVGEWQITSYGYAIDEQDSHLDQPTSMALPGDGPDYTYTRDSRGLLMGEGIEENGFESHPIQYQYDELGRLIRTLYSGVETKRWYDKDGHLVRGEVYSDGLQPNRVTASYNLRGWLERETWQLGASLYELSYSYDDSGNVTSMTYPDGTVVPFSYDWAGRLQEIDGYVDSIIYNGNDTPTSVAYANGVATTYTPDARNRLQGIQAINGITGDTILDLAYTFTRSGNVSSITETRNGIATPLTYRYDAASQLVYADVLTPTGTSAVEYMYDGIGNRMRESGAGGVNPVPYTYQPGNFLQLTTRGSTAYSWGRYGQLIGKTDRTTRTTYDYDPRRLMSQVIVDGSAVESYEYDAMGRRIVASDGAGRTLTFYSGNDVVYEAREAETLQGEPPAQVQTTTTTCYIVLSGKYLARVSKENGGVPEKQYLHTDVLGSIRAVTDAEGQVIARYDYEPFGLLTGSSGSVAGSERYTGKPYDAPTGLYCFGARYYDPEVGRFTSLDPVHQGANWYAYCASNPLTLVDPDGKTCYVFYAPEFAWQASVEADMLAERYDTWTSRREVRTEAEFVRAWASMGQHGEEIDGVSLLFHSKPQAIIIDSHEGHYLTALETGKTPLGIDATYIGDLPKKGIIGELRLLGCNTASHDVYENVARVFQETQGCTTLGRDGKLSYGYFSGEPRRSIKEMFLGLFPWWDTPKGWVTYE